MTYLPDSSRYKSSNFYRRCGNSGLKISALSFGLWHNFGENHPYDNSRALALGAFDLGITHFDLANNYGPPPGSAESCFGEIVHSDLRDYRDELLVSTKAGYDMWDGPYGNWGSRKHITASIDQSLKRLRLDYVDIFYHHRPDPDTPLEETMCALDQIVRAGKALYIGLSNYTGEQTGQALSILQELNTPCIIHQPRYNMFERKIENDLFPTLEKNGMGSVVFCPLAQGLLTNRYLDGIPKDSRAAKDSKFLNANDITSQKLDCIHKLNEIATQRGQSLAQMALRWVLRNRVVTSAIIGASRVSQIEENVRAFEAAEFSPQELTEINRILTDLKG